MKSIFAILVAATFVGLTCNGQPTNQAWLNASRLATGFVPAARLGTNDTGAADGSFLTKSGDKSTWVGALPGSGTVTSIGIIAPGGLLVSGSPVTASGTITVSAASISGFWTNNGSGGTGWTTDGAFITGLAQGFSIGGWSKSATNAVNSTNYFGTLSGTNYLFSSPVAPSATNMVVDCKLGVYQKIAATNDINFLYMTNGPGAVAFKIRPGGADRLLTFPTNWVWLSTNSFTLSGSLWAVTLTNASTGAGPRVGWFSAVMDGGDQTNVVAKYVESP